jgi:hypothetical protein
MQEMIGVLAELERSLIVEYHALNAACRAIGTASILRAGQRSDSIWRRSVTAPILVATHRAPSPSGTA